MLLLIFEYLIQQNNKKKFDKEKKYIKKWIPEYDTDEYPKEIVDHKLARARCLKTYKEVLS